MREKARKHARGRKTKKGRSAVGRWLERASRVITDWTGSSWAFAVATLVILVWIVTGPIFHYSDTWQLVINTGTTIVTFLMVFLIQRSQNKDSLAVQLKLNELVAAMKGASNRLIDVEDLSEDELRLLHRHFAALATMAKRDVDLGESHSVEEAETRHRRKHGPRAQEGPREGGEAEGRAGEGAGGDVDGGAREDGDGGTREDGDGGTHEDGDGGTREDGDGGARGGGDGGAGGR